MSRVLLATLGSLGDLHPLLAIGRELRQRGHEVLVATSASYQNGIESAGLCFRPLRPDLGAEDASMAQVISEIMDARKGVERLLRGVLTRLCRGSGSDLVSSHRVNFPIK